jgi:glucose/arabinose dehydrogenase
MVITADCIKFSRFISKTISMRFLSWVPILIFFCFFVIQNARASESLLDKIKLPPGFSISIYADQIPNARSLSLSPSGILFVGSRKAGRVYAVIDHDRDFKADEIVTIAKGLNMPNGVAFHDGDLYVAEVHRIIKFKDIEKNLRRTGPPQVINDSYPSDKWHGWKFIRIGPDNKLYVPVGAPCNVCEPEKPLYGTITRLNLDGTGLEIFARGVRNSVGFDWHPKTGELWFTDNGRDFLGDNLPPDELNHASEPGLHFGFPYLHGKNINDPQYGSQAPLIDFTLPAQELGPHVASLGMRFYTGKMFPAAYKDQIFIAEHGSWNRSEPIGYRLTMVKLVDSKVQSYEVFAQGWLLKDDVLGRPVDIEIMPDGSLLVSDDYGDKIYRIIYKKQ